MARDENRCVVCGVPSHEWHHRRSRSVRDSHTHCPCNGVRLCRTCHKWVTEHPTAAQREGLVVSRGVPVPGAVLVLTFHGWVQLGCDGSQEAA